MSKRFEVRAKHLLELVKWTAPRDYGRPVLQCLHFRLDGHVEAADGFRMLRVKARGHLPAALAGALVDVREPSASLVVWQALMRFAKEEWVGVSLRRRKGAETVVFEYASMEVALPAQVGRTYPDTDLPMFTPVGHASRVALSPRFLAALTTLQLKDQSPIVKFEMWGRSEPVIVTARDTELEVELRALIMPMYVQGWDSDEAQAGVRDEVAG